MDESVTFKAQIGDEIKDSTTGVVGEVSVQCRSRHQQGYWIQSTDSTGRPFEHYVDERDATDLHGRDLA